MDGKDEVGAASEKGALAGRFPTLRVLPDSMYLRFLHMKIRDRKQARSKFVFYSDQLMRLLCEYAFNSVPCETKTVTTPTGNEFKGVSFGSICGVSIMRSGEAMEGALRSLMLDVKIGKVLVQRDAETQRRTLLYSKLPQDINQHHVLLLDPVLASGSSAICALEHLIEAGIKQEQISFLTCIACPEGVANVLTKFPKVTLVCTMVDSRLDSQKNLVPGIGEFSDRYFGT